MAHSAKTMYRTKEGDDVMVSKTAVEEREALHGERMIEVKIRFWTNDIAEVDGNVVPKHAWSNGVVRMESNKSHGIIPQKPVPLHSLMDLPAVIEKVIIAHGITLHPSRRTRKYLETHGK